MRKFFQFFLMAVMVLVGFVLPMTALAATIRLSGVPANVSNGSVFTASVFADPQGVPLYTAKATITFPSDVLSVTGFSFANGVFPLAQKGYDAIDNTAGELIKTAGFPGGISAEKLLGTITFYAKSVGTGTIKVDAGNSLLLNATNQNVYVSSSDGGAMITVNAPSQPVGNGAANKIVSPQTASTAPVSIKKSKTTPSQLAQLAVVPSPTPQLPFALLALAYMLYPFSNVMVVLVFVIVLLGCVVALYRNKKSIGHEEVNRIVRAYVGNKKIKLINSKRVRTYAQIFLASLYCGVGVRGGRQYRDCRYSCQSSYNASAGMERRFNTAHR